MTAPIFTPPAGEPLSDHSWVPGFASHELYAAGEIVFAVVRKYESVPGGMNAAAYAAAARRAARRLARAKSKAERAVKSMRDAGTAVGFSTRVALSEVSSWHATLADCSSEDDIDALRNLDQFAMELVGHDHARAVALHIQFPKMFEAPGA